MLSCKDISNLASDHIDNNLSPMMKLKVRVHLLLCRHCRTFFKQFNVTVNSLTSLKSPPLDNSAIDSQVEQLKHLAKKLNIEKNSGNKP